MSLTNKKPDAKNKIPAHPTFVTMVINAAKALKYPRTTRPAIKKFILSKYKLGDNASVLVRNAIKKGVGIGLFTLPKGPSGPLKLDHNKGKLLYPETATTGPRGPGSVKKKGGSASVTKKKPAQKKLSTTKTHAMSTTKTHAMSTTKDHAISTTKTHAISATKTHAISTTKAHAISTTKAHAISATKAHAEHQPSIEAAVGTSTTVKKNKRATVAGGKVVTLHKKATVADAGGKVITIHKKVAISSGKRSKDAKKTPSRPAKKATAAVPPSSRSNSASSKLASFTKKKIIHAKTH